MVILLCDMNSFFASVHQSVDPSLANKPVIVAGQPQKRKGIVVAASYEAKQCGVYTTMHYYEAKKRCPDAVFVQPDHRLYKRYSRIIMNFLRKIAPCEVASVDEAYLDVSDHVRRGIRTAEIAGYIQHKLKKELNIPCSIGAGPNKVIAKMCAEVKKPQGFVEMGVRQFQTYFWPKPVSLLHGCGKRTVEKLQRKKIMTIGDLAQTTEENLVAMFGKKGRYLYLASNGMYQSPVDPDRKKGDKSLGKSRTFPEDVSDEKQISRTAREFSVLLAERLKDKDKVARTVTVEVKHEYAKTHTRSLSIENGIRSERDIYEAAWYLYRTYFAGKPVRLFGIRVHNLAELKYEQLKFPF